MKWLRVRGKGRSDDGDLSVYPRIRMDRPDGPEGPVISLVRLSADTEWRKLLPGESVVMGGVGPPDLCPKPGTLHHHTAPEAEL